MTIYWGTGIAVAVWMIGAWIMTHVYRFGGPNAYMLFYMLSVLGISGGAFVAWFQNRRQKAQAAAQQQAQAAAAGGGEAAPAPGTEELDLLVRDAEARLAASRLAQGAALSNLPVVLLMGDPGATKTSVFLRSGLEPELLAGQVYQDNNVVPTRSANLWYARQAVFVEAGGRLMSDSNRWVRLLKKLQPGKLKSVVGAGGQAPRAAVVFFDCESFAKSGSTDFITAAARNIHTRLGEISQQYGINFPVYVLFSKADRVPFFGEFVRTLTNEEANQVFGCTLAIRPPHSSGVYAEEETRRLNQAFNDLFFSLADKRIVFLPRENDPETIPGAYEFPREFRKLRASIVQFLVDVGRPSQLRASAFLRGFYFTGVRPIVVTDTPAPVMFQPQQQSYGAEQGGATQIFVNPALRAQGLQTPMQAAPAVAGGTRRVPQWMFLSHLFNDVILKDREAMGASGASTKTSKMQRILLIVGAALCFLLLIAFTVSYFGNRSLEQDSLTAARGISGVEAAGGAVPSLDSLKRLEALRQQLELLTKYEQEGAPFRLRWFLYTGDDLYPEVYRAYYSRFWQLLFGQTQAGLLAFLQRVPASPGPNDDYAFAYDTLKAYLITTSHHDKSSKQFLSPLLLSRWSTGKSVDPERTALVSRQFDFYSVDLIRKNPFTSENDANAVDRSRRYLAQFNAIERIYNFMIAEANRQNPVVNFNARFPGSAEVIINNRDVPGAFTKPGWDFMMNAIKKADRYFGGEQWVLGDYKAQNIDRAKLEQDLTDRYTADFIRRWREYFQRNTMVRPYSDYGDAARKLNLFSANTSPMLALFWLASQNTNVDSPKVKEAMQPTFAVVPPEQVDRYVGPTNQGYLSSLLALQGSMDQVSRSSPPDPGAVAASQNNASNARNTTRQLSANFRIDQQAQLNQTAERLLMEPITQAERLMRGAGPAELNAKGRALCLQFTGMQQKFPFKSDAIPEVTIPELHALLRPPNGQIWTFYEQNLKQMLVKTGNRYEINPQGSPGMTITPAFLRFWNDITRFAEVLYANNAQDPKITYSLQPLRSEQVQSMTLRISGQSVSLGNPPRQFVWLGGQSQDVKVDVNNIEVFVRGGQWAIFRFFADAERITPTGTAYTMEWNFRTGRENRVVFTYRFLLDTGGAPPVFDKNYLASLKCVAQVAQSK